MADPISLSLAAGGAALGAYGSLYKGMAGAGAANYQAGVANMNAQIAEQNAGYERAKGEYEAEQIGMKGRYQLGTMKTTQAASGVDVNTGSAVDARTSMASITSLEEATARNRAARAA